MKPKTIRKVYYAAGRAYDVPCIKLEGDYLKDYGFKVGDIFSVYYGPGQIVIKKGRSSNEDSAFNKWTEVVIPPGMEVK